MLSLVALSGCAPLIRLGDIEPPPGERVLIEVEVRPRREGVSPAELAAAVDATGIASLATAPVSAVTSSTAESEMSSSVQGLSVPAEDALVDPGEIATDARRLESIYMARGYYRARSTGHTLIPIGADRARVVFEVTENEETIVSEIKFLGACESELSPETEVNARLTDEEKAEERRRIKRLCEAAVDTVEIRVGDLWDEQLYASGLDSLARAFRSEGFIHARVTGDNWVSIDQHKAAVSYQIASGPLVRVRGEVRIEGAQRVKLSRIRRRIDIVPGDVIDSVLLRRVERRVADLGPFFSVQAQAVRDQGRSQRQLAETPAETADADGDEVRAIERPRLASSMPLKLQVAEAPRWELTIGPSFVTDFVRLDIALPTRFTHRNLFDELVALDIRAKPALVFPDCFTGDACLDKTGFGIDSRASIDIPSFFEEYLRFSINATYRRDPSQDTQSQEVGGSVGLSRRIVEGLTARIGYNLAFFNYFGTGALDGLSAEDALSQAELRFKTQDLLAWLDLALVLDLRDNPLDSRNGFYSALSANFAQGALGSEVDYTRLVGDVRGYWTPRFLPMLTLAARFKVGWNFVDQTEGTPQPARFRSGGATTMRGFATDRIGDYVCAEPDASGNYINNPDCGEGSSKRTYVGGNYLIESNFEVRLRFRNGLGLVAFADIGRVWSRRGDVGADPLYVAIGPGLRYDLPVGPIRLDLGFLLGKQRATELHFSLGQAF
jgi:outer membrane protein insertion porin family/translocation and assembly module TamA